jgi:hypothetical protein
LIAVFFRGELLQANSRYLPPPYSFYGGGYRSMHFWGLAGVRFLFYLNLYGNIYMFTFKKNILRNVPCQIRDRILESLANFCLEQTFRIFKNLQKHIPARGVNQGYSTEITLAWQMSIHFRRTFRAVHGCVHSCTLNLVQSY